MPTQSEPKTDPAYMRDQTATYKQAMSKGYLTPESVHIEHRQSGHQEPSH